MMEVAKHRSTRVVGWWLRTYRCQWWQDGGWVGQQVVGNVDKHRHVGHHKSIADMDGRE